MQLPPLAAVRVFEAAARLGNFTKAAEELGMTQAAVSYQIKVLEERVGAPLFLRRPRQVALTEIGKRLAPKMSEAFAIIAEAYASARTGVQETLNITTMLTFASHWLAKHIGAFQIANPLIAVRVDTNSDLVDFTREEFDIGIRSGRGGWPGVVAHKLFNDGFAPMLTRKLADSIGGIHEPADLLKLPLLDPSDPWWVQWFAEMGVHNLDLKSRPNVRLGSQAFEANAAMAGNGVAILTRAFFTQELADGRLIQPFDHVGDDGQAFWLAYHETRRNVPKIKAFRDWILPTVERTTGAT
ncbi:MAG: LysR substrate-binding domain-containing protein [Rhizobiaceae bacterium]